MNLTAKQKARIMKAARRECAGLLTDDWGDPFKHRDINFPANDEEDEDELLEAADDYFFECVKQIAREIKSS